MINTLKAIIIIIFSNYLSLDFLNNKSNICAMCIKNNVFNNLFFFK